jgi:hypothetical protein
MQEWSWGSLRAAAARRGLPDGLLIAIMATVALLISLVLPWYKGTVILHGANGTTLYGTVLSGAKLSGTTSALGAAAGGWRFLILFVAVIELLYLLVLALWLGRPGTVVGWLWVPVGLAGLLVALVLAAFLVKPADKGPQFGGMAAMLSYRVTDEVGAYIAFGAALAALVFLINAIRKA